MSTYRSDHLTDKHNRCFPTAGAARENPLTVEIQEELRARVDVNTSTMLPKQGKKKNDTGSGLEPGIRRFNHGNNNLTIVLLKQPQLCNKLWFKILLYLYTHVNNIF